MKTLLKLEALALAIFYSWLYFKIQQGNTQLFFILFLAPDISIIAYGLSSKVGAIAYNIFHHQGALLLFGLYGALTNNPWLINVCLIFLVHSSSDRLFGFGLKYSDHFKHTHLGTLK